jgi:hypothetical protein
MHLQKPRTLENHPISHAGAADVSPGEEAAKEINPTVDGSSLALSRDANRSREPWGEGDTIRQELGEIRRSLYQYTARHAAALEFLEQKNSQDQTSKEFHQDLDELGEQIRSLTNRVRRLCRSHQRTRALLRRTLQRSAHRDQELFASLYELQNLMEGGNTNALTDRQKAYRQLIHRLRQEVRRLTPTEATVVVVSRGDPELLKLFGRRGWHFPQSETGVYAGYHPADSAAAIAHLEAMRAKGGEYLVFPATGHWWLEYYGAFKRHLERTYRLLYQSNDTCSIFALQESSPWVGLVALVADFKSRHQRFPAILNWGSGVDLAKTFPECVVFTPLEGGGRKLLYVEESIDIVAVRSCDPDRLHDARRVASEAVLILAPSGTGRGDLQVTVERVHRGGPNGSPEHPTCARRPAPVPLRIP